MFNINNCAKVLIALIVIVNLMKLANRNTEHFAGYGGFLDVLTKPFKSVGKAIGGGLSKIKNTITGIASKISNIARKISRLPRKIADKIKGVVTVIIKAVKDKIIGGIRKLWDGIKGAFTKIWKGIKKIFDKIKGAFVNLWKGIKTAFSKIWNGIKRIFKKIGKFFKKLWSGIKKAFIKMWAGIKKVFKKIRDFLKKMISVIAKWFKQFWGKIKSFFKKLWAILTDPFGWFMGIFAKIVKKITGDIGKQANKSIWSYVSPENRPFYMKHYGKIFIAIVIGLIAAGFGINYGLNYLVNKDLCIDPKTGKVKEDENGNPIKLKDDECPYNIPEGMCEDPETLEVFRDPEFGEMVRADSAACPTSTFDMDGGVPVENQTTETIQQPTNVPMEQILKKVENQPVQTATVQEASTTQQAVSDFRQKLRSQSGGTRKKKRRRRSNNPENLIKTYKKYLKLYN